MRAVGVDLGGTKTAVAVVAPDGTMGEVLTAPTPALAGGEAVLDAVADLAARAAAGHDDVAGVGVGTAGVVDATRGAIISATETFASWVGTDVAAGLRARLGWDDARLVEVRNGVDGHLEAVAAGPAIERAYALAAGEPLPGRDIMARAADGGEPARGVVAAAAVALGRAIAGVVTVLDPACVVIGGGVAAAGDEWWRPLRAACRGEVVPVLRNLELLPAALGPEAAILGAACTVFDEARVRVR